MNNYRAEMLSKVEGYGYDLSMYPSGILIDAFDYASETIYEKTQIERDPNWREFEQSLNYLVELYKLNYQD